MIPAETVQVDFTLRQGCCGLPLMMLGRERASRELARNNLLAIDPDRYDYILTLCVSCGSHVQGYAALLRDIPELAAKAERFAGKVIDFSSFVNDVLGGVPEPGRLFHDRPGAAYHAPCHLCRGMGVRNAPKELLTAMGLTYIENEEEETCCGLGGTYSLHMNIAYATKNLAQVYLMKNFYDLLLIFEGFIPEAPYKTGAGGRTTSRKGQ